MASPPDPAGGRPKSRTYPVDAALRQRLLAAQAECIVMWTTTDGSPLGMPHWYLWERNRLWVTCTAARRRVSALEARPASAVSISSEGTELGSSISVVARTVATVHRDLSTLRWFGPLMARRQRRTSPGEIHEFTARLEEVERVVIEFAPVRWYGHNGARRDAELRGARYDESHRKRSYNVGASSADASG